MAMHEFGTGWVVIGQDDRGNWHSVVKSGCECTVFESRAAAMDFRDRTVGPKRAKAVKVRWTIETDEE